MIQLTFSAIELRRAPTHVSVLSGVCIHTGSIVQARLEKVAWSIGVVAESTRRDCIGTQRREKRYSISDKVRVIFSANHRGCSDRHRSSGFV